MFSGSLRSFLYSSSVYSCYLFFISLLLLGLYHFCPLLCPSLHEMFPWYLQFSWRDLSLSHSIVFFCIIHLSRPSYLSLLFSGTLHSDWYIFPFLLCLSLLFFSQLFVRPPQTTTLPSLTFFFFQMVLVTASCTVLQTSIHISSGTLSTKSKPLNLFVTSTV